MVAYLMVGCNMWDVLFIALFLAIVAGGLLSIVYDVVAALHRLQTCSVLADANRINFRNWAKCGLQFSASFSDRSSG